MLKAAEDEAERQITYSAVGSSNWIKTVVIPFPLGQIVIDLG